VDRQGVAAWLEAYAHAWQTYDAGEIAALFSQDASYRYHPWDEPLRGREPIVASWLEEPDAPGTYEGRYQPLVVEGEQAVATGRSRYLDPDGALKRQYHNCFVLRFDGEGRCGEFTEWFMLHPPEVAG
jgi:hypothetical protein